MSNGRVLGSRIVALRTTNDKGECLRCGVERAIHGGANRTGLCRDCSSAMTPAEREEWRPKSA